MDKKNRKKTVKDLEQRKLIFGKNISYISEVLEKTDEDIVSMLVYPKSYEGQPISLNVWGKYRNGVNIPRAGKLNVIKHTFNLTEDDLFKTDMRVLKKEITVVEPPIKIEPPTKDDDIPFIIQLVSKQSLLITEMSLEISKLRSDFNNLSKKLSD